MKLVDILARELDRWVDWGDKIVQDDDGYIVAFEHEAELKCVDGDWKGPSCDPICVLDLAEDHKTSIVTRAEWRAAVDALNQSELDAVLAKNEQLAAARAERIPSWNGEGLPPVGLDVEIKRGNCTWIDGDEWQIGKTATVMASFLNSRDIEMTSVQFPGGHCECILARCLSPIRTAEQVAAEECKSEILEMIDTFGTDTAIWGRDAVMEICGHLWESGYRKEPKPCGS